MKSENILRKKNSTILITGGTGYLGRHITSRLLKEDPHAIRVYSRDEVKHHEIHERFNNEPRIRNFIGDVRDYDRLRKATRDCDIVIHAAALKRLDILEYNVEESIKTNIIGSLNVVNACLENNVQKAILVSTDKACSPINTYGASKFVSERIFIESNFSKGSKPTKFICVRYGNVLESTGSVIPFFISKIKNGDSIPLTHKDMTRFIITGEQAVELILDSIRYGRGGEVFIPKLPAFRIVDLIDLLKEKHKADNRIEIVGIRPGEKIHELMINESEVFRTYNYKNIYVISSHIERYGIMEKACYMQGNVPLSMESMREYSSKDAVLPLHNLKDLLAKLGIA